MKRLSTISVSLVLLTVLILSFQNTALAASQKGSPIGKQVNTIVPNCPVAKSSSITPLCVLYPPCTATDCYGIDPYVSHCGTATTYNHISYVQTPIQDDPTHIYGYLTNYYSSWCTANWAVVSLTTTGYKSSIITSLSIFTYEGPPTQGNHEEMCYPNICYPFSYYTGITYPTWTNMIDGRNTTYSHVYVSIGGKPFYINPLEADQ